MKSKGSQGCNSEINAWDTLFAVNKTENSFIVSPYDPLQSTLCVSKYLHVVHVSTPECDFAFIKK